eukprot:9040748-Lingulodinium_polyedra.AAC.1
MARVSVVWRGVARADVSVADVRSNGGNEGAPSASPAGTARGINNVCYRAGLSGLSSGVRGKIFGG